MDPSLRNEPLKLEYSHEQPGPRGIEVIATRLVAGAAGLFFAYGVFEIWRGTSRGNFDRFSFLRPAVLVSLSASVFLLLMAVFGWFVTPRKKSD